MNSLSNIKQGETVTIDSIVKSPLRVKLMEMGLNSGSNVTLLFKAPLGDPLAYQLDGNVISLRKSEADLIHVLELS